MISLFLWLTLALSATAQNATIAGLLEDALAGENRAVTVTGLTGALSARAEIERIDISDVDGIWLTIRGAVLDWDRRALLSGAIDIRELSARRITVVRAPGPAPGADDLPEAEATAFALPELPVSVEIDSLRVSQVDLPASLVGVDAVLSVDGSVGLIAGALDATLTTQRLDRPSDRLDLKASFANATQRLTLDLQAREDPGGLVGRALALPGAPDIALDLQGDGPLDDFAARLALATDGQDRLTGQARLLTGADGLRFDADLGGDLRPLMDSSYHPFFGDTAQARLSGLRASDGAMQLDTLSIDTQALQLSGQAALDAQGVVTALDVTGRMGLRSGTALVLPVPGAMTRIQSADIALRFDASTGAWRLTGDVDGITTPDLRLPSARLSGEGRLIQTGTTRLTGQVDLQATGLDLSDDALQQAVGPTPAVSGGFDWQTGSPLVLRDLRLEAISATLDLNGAISGLESGFTFDGRTALAAPDLSRLSLLVGERLNGALRADLTGQVTPLSGAFDLTLDGTANDIGIGTPQIDALIGGTSRVNLAAKRDETGIALRRFSFTGDKAEATASGTLSNSGGALNVTARIAQIAPLVPQLPGVLAIKADVSGEGGDWSGSGRATLDGPTDAQADLSGTLTGEGDTSVAFNARLADLRRFVPQLGGDLGLSGTAERTGGVWQIKASGDGSAGVRGSIEAALTEATQAIALRYDASLARVQRFAAQFPGRVTARGTVRGDGPTWRIDTTASGPGNLSARIAGSYDTSTARADLSARGQIALGLLDTALSPNSLAGTAAFDLALRGAPTLNNLSGGVRTSGARLALGDLGQSVNAIDTTVTLQGARAQVAVSAQPQNGGTLSVGGPIALEPPFVGDLNITLGNVVLTNNLNVNSSVSGGLRLSGPLSTTPTLSGALRFGETEIDLGATAGAFTYPAIPNMRHVGDSAAVRQTRDRAGLTATASGGAGPVIGLNIVLDAPSRIFARGRGLQAELGGRLSLRGTSADPQPAGQIGLIRGTFDLLGRRLSLDDGRITLAGGLIPFIDMRATTSTSEGDATLVLSGPVDAPEIEVLSSPERPTEEALALLLFGDQFSDLSPLRIAQLASQIATLRGGRGGLVENLRNQLGVDVLDIGTDDDGTAQVGVGAYLGENVYTDVTVNADGKSELSLNLDLTDDVTLRGRVTNEGDSGIGIFFERDY